MSEESNKIHTEFAELTTALRKGEIPFLLVGGLSLLAHHVERATGDIDFFCDKKSQALIEKVMTEAGYSRMHENLPLFIRYHQAGKRVVDFIFVNTDTFSQLEEAALASEISGVRVPVPSLNHLLAMKLFSLSQQWTRGKDFGDILSLIHQNNVDVQSPEFEAICLKYASGKWLNLIRELE